jgi:hypothetical protein
MRGVKNNAQTDDFGVRGGSCGQCDAFARTAASQKPYGAALIIAQGAGWGAPLGGRTAAAPREDELHPAVIPLRFMAAGEPFPTPSEAI